MITQNLLHLLFIFSLLFSQTCYCMNPNICSPSSCGSIRNISYPFRLKHDPKHCGRRKYELSCENNETTLLNLNSQEYKVKAIHYANRSIWLVDASVKNDNICSFPHVSVNDYFLRRYPFNIYNIDWFEERLSLQSISLMRCPYALKNSSSLFFTQLPTHCEAEASNRNSISGLPTLHTYIRVGYMTASDVGENCRVELIVQTWWNFSSDVVSASEIHDSLLYGFLLSWDSGYGCSWCNGRQVCPRNDADIVGCSHALGPMLEALWGHIKFLKYPYEKNTSGPTAAVVFILLLILVDVFAGVTLPATIILGFICAFIFIIIEMNQEGRFLNTYWPVEHLHVIFGLFFALRFIVIFPCISCFFIYKFRRRHLSRFAAIEDFLQSENNLMPMRYSYSDIKKMTRGFREKLGQGGYGTVYKGKLRSGYDVAVKLLGNPGGNGQDFMNEISTIGRIHHVNVVKLVGYCAERSKRALVFDYMPNGSLDKYLYNQEDTNCLSWGRKYEIAIGVARGIEYLHRGCDIQILHFDIKPHNILLDDNFIPKITDFGLAKFFSPEKRVVTMTAIRGTIGYVAPELINRGFGEVSYKADVYSFGMLLMEIVGLNKHLKGNNQTSSQYFPDWIYDCFEQGHDIEELIDENDNGTNKEIAKKMTIVALWCIQMSPGDRPSMNKVVEMLEAKVERLRVPNKPSESARVAVTYEDQSLSTYSTDSVSLVPHDATSSVEITVED